MHTGPGTAMQCASMGRSGHSKGTLPAPFHHEPVMASEVVAALRPARGGVFVDATFGGGGYSRAMLDAGAGTVIALDCDATAIEHGRKQFRSDSPRIVLVHANFCCLEAVVAKHTGHVQGIVFDLGVSSMQLDSAKRGFSFRRSGPLDMRMGDEGPTAADLLNELGEDALARILREYGEEPAATRIARAVVRERQHSPIRTTAQFADLVRVATGRSAGRTRIDPATRSFQAVRIAVNNELVRLARVLPVAERLLAAGAVLCVVTFHSLEDRVVKGFFARRSGQGSGNRHLPPSLARPSSFRLSRPHCLRPGAEEVERNPRSRSARLRAGERTVAAPHPSDVDGPAPWRRKERSRHR